MCIQYIHITGYMARGRRIVPTASKLGRAAWGALLGHPLAFGAGLLAHRSAFRELFFTGSCFVPLWKSFWGCPDSQNR